MASAAMPRLNLAGYVLAGGRSSRMGREKALVELAGKPLVEHAVTKLRRVGADVRILSANPALASFGPLLPDIHLGCGPLAGFETGLTRSGYDWNLFYPVDMPFLPTAFLGHWVRTTSTPRTRMRIGMFTVDERPQPTLALLHREVLPFISQALEEQEYTVYPVLERAGKELARRQGLILGQVFRNLPLLRENVFSTDEYVFASMRDPWMLISDAQQRARSMWFANLNTPEDLAEAEAHADALDT